MRLLFVALFIAGLALILLGGCTFVQLGTEIATTRSATKGGWWSQSWDAPCHWIGGTVVPRHGTHGPHDCEV